MNIVVLNGNLVADPEIKTIESKGRTSTVASFRIANNRFFKQANGDRGESSTFVDCEAWDSGAKLIGELLSKGDGVIVSGYLKQDNWEKDGQKHSKLKIRVDEFTKIRKAGGSNEAAVAAPEEALVGAGVGAEGENIPF